MELRILTTLAINRPSKAMGQLRERQEDSYLRQEQRREANEMDDVVQRSLVRRIASQRALGSES